MYARILTFNGAKDVDAGVTFLTEKAVPVLRQHHGFRGVNASADRAANVLGVLSLWDTPEDRDRSFAAMAGLRADSESVVGVAPEVDNFEATVFEVGSPPPATGCVLMVTGIHMDPAKIDDNVAYFRNEVVPRMKQQAGFRGVRHMVDRESGDGMVGTVWTDDDAMRTWAEESRAARKQAVDRGVTFSEPSFREILLVEGP
jgi:heme-degrading monooxygenase HmoA